MARKDLGRTAKAEGPKGALLWKLFWKEQSSSGQKQLGRNQCRQVRQPQGTSSRESQ